MLTTRLTTRLLTTVLAGLALTGCGGDDGTGAAPASSEASSSPAGTAAPVLLTGDTDLGEVLTDAEGRTAYVFDEDQAGSGESACTGECAGTWPAIVAEDGEPAAEGVDGELGTIEREDGALQVTLDGRPLYVFAGDGAPGDTTGQGVDGTWWVVGADGEKITEGGDDPGFSY